MGVTKHKRELKLLENFVAKMNFDELKLEKDGKKTGHLGITVAHIGRVETYFSNWLPSM